MLEQKERPYCKNVILRFIDPVSVRLLKFPGVVRLQFYNAIGFLDGIGPPRKRVNLIKVKVKPGSDPFGGVAFVGSNAAFAQRIIIGVIGIKVIVTNERLEVRQSIISPKNRSYETVSAGVGNFGRVNNRRFFK
jgi:hypothetical protein